MNLRALCPRSTTSRSGVVRALAEYGRRNIANLSIGIILHHVANQFRAA